MPRVKKIPDERVLDLALALLSRGGPEGFTLPALSAEVGLSPATLLQRFGSKAALLEATLDRATLHLEERVRRLELGPDPQEALLAWVGSFTGPLVTRPLLASQLSLLARDIGDARWRARAARHMALFREGLAAPLARMGSPTPAAHAMELEVLFHGLTIQWGLHGEGPLTDWVRQGVEAWLARRLVGAGLEQRSPGE